MVKRSTNCFISEVGFFWDLTVDASTGFITGSFFDPAGNTKDVIAGRGFFSNRTIRHHTLTAIDPTLSDDPSCFAGSGYVDWLSYNGTVTGNSPPFGFTGNYLNSCGSSGPVTGTITTGACPAPRPGAPLAVEGPNAVTVRGDGQAVVR